jgi:hypothetical protein
MRRRGRALPVVDHLDRQDEVQDETCNEAIENEVVVDFLQGSEDARQGASEVVEDLNVRLAVCPHLQQSIHTAKALNCPVPPCCQTVQI